MADIGLEEFDLFIDRNLEFVREFVVVAMERWGEDDLQRHIMDLRGGAPGSLLRRSRTGQ